MTDVTVTGIVKNHCDQAGYPRISWTAYNRDGSVIFTSAVQFDPQINIARGQSYPFEEEAAAPVSAGKSTLEVVGVGVMP